jgi:geranylgeranyl pyrophosphate synthase
MIKNRLSNNLSVEDNLKITSDIIRERISEILAKNSDAEQNVIIDAMNYMLLGGGKMLRPFLVFATSLIYAPNIPKCIVDLAVAIEMIHTYTLIHDDLPAMDDDDYRRGRLSCHKKFKESAAILTGDALLTLAFEILSSDNDTSINSKVQLNVVNGMAKLIGFQGTLLGQILDLDCQVQKYSAEQLKRARILKTSNLLIASCKFSAMINDADAKDIDVLYLFAQKLGLAYQIKDDIDDDEYEEGQDLLKGLVNESLKHLDIFGNKSLMLRDFTSYLFKSCFK